MKASFVIVNYNRREEVLITISKTRELIQDRAEEYEIVVVDNASTDGSARAIREKFPDVVVVEKDVNIGAPAWNDGFAIAKGNYFIIIDDDSHIESGLEEAITHLDQHPEIGVLALNVITGPYTSDVWLWKDGMETVGFIGCGAILRRETYQKVGGYADWIFLYVNEWEYGIRATEAGYKVKFFENCRVIHRASKSHRSSKRLRVFAIRNELGIVYKYFGYKRNTYLWRVIGNNIKVSLKNLFLKEVWYNLIGIREFLKMRKTLRYTPVSRRTQELYADSNWNTKPFFGFIGRHLAPSLRARRVDDGPLEVSGRSEAEAELAYEENQDLNRRL